MANDKSSDSDQLFVETSLGILSRTGEWFHTTSEHIKRYVPGLLEAVSLEMLIRDAQAWVRSADSLSIILLMVLFFVLNPWLAALVALVFHWFWYRYKSAFANRFLGTIFRFLNKDAFPLIISFLALSYLGMSGNYTAAILGLVFFVLVKPGLLSRLWNAIHKEDAANLSLNDRMLNMLIIKYAMYEDVPPPAVSQMEEKFKELARSRKKGKQRN